MYNPEEPMYSYWDGIITQWGDEMSKSRTFRVQDGRALFVCPSCRSRKMIAVGANLRRRMVRCQKCGEKTNCVFNRRQWERVNQKGRVLLLLDGNQIEVDLCDISERGVGFELGVRSGIKIAVGREIEFRCSWNPRLFKHGRYVVRSVRGLKVGAEYRK